MRLLLTRYTRIVRLFLKLENVFLSDQLHVWRVLKILTMFESVKLSTCLDTAPYIVILHYLLLDLL